MSDTINHNLSINVLEEPKVPKDCPFPSLSTTVFSCNGFKFTQHYKQFGHLSTELLNNLNEGVRILFYEDINWFMSHRNELKRYAQWCDQESSKDYSVTLD